MPAKESLLKLLKKKDITNQQNLFLTLGLVAVCYILSVAVPNIKAAIALTGATFNPLTGFLYPVFFSLKLDPAPLLSAKKLFCLFMFFFFSISSILGLYQFFIQYSTS